ncbi:MAG TPA: hypothetical protein VK162_23535 [Streptosporangiaceae bacterium]|nr:hypothetical protein [Streptosporangiaceae bacterium]
MSAPTRKDVPGLTRRDEMAVSGAALSKAPWAVAGAAGAAVAGGDLVLHLLTAHLAVTSSLSAGAVAFFAVAAGGVARSNAPGRAMRWVRQNPWRFAIMPGVACAMVVFVLSVVLGGGEIVGGAFTALWHGAIAYGLVGAAGSVGSARRRTS